MGGLLMAAADIDTALTTAMTSMESTTQGHIATILPYALAIVATVLGIRKAISFTKSVVGN